VWSVGLPLHHGRAVSTSPARERRCEAAQIVHDKSVEGIDSARERHANARGLFEDLIVVPGVFQVAALWRVGDWRAAVGNRIGIDAHADASPVRRRRRIVR
jgi:hypothetical protein